MSYHRPSYQITHLTLFNIKKLAKKKKKKKIHLTVLIKQVEAEKLIE